MGTKVVVRKKPIKLNRRVQLTVKDWDSVIEGTDPEVPGRDSIAETLNTIEKNGNVPERKKVTVSVTNSIPRKGGCWHLRNMGVGKPRKKTMAQIKEGLRQQVEALPTKVEKLDNVIEEQRDSKLG